MQYRQTRCMEISTTTVGSDYLLSIFDFFGFLNDYCFSNFIKKELIFLKKAVNTKKKKKKRNA